MADIKIRVEGRKATNLTPEVKLVTWNEGYEAEFEFDESWKASELKTALFITKGQTIRKPFKGDKCEVPMLVGVEILRVGVESSDILGLKTTVAAVVECELSARDLSGEEVEAPTPSVYDEIIELINAGMVKGDKGDKGEKGDKGDAGAIKFMAVTSLPTENIATDAIYLLPMPDGMGDNIFAEYVYIDGKWEVLGSVALNVDHSEYVKFTDYATASKAGVFKVDAEKGITVGNDGVASLYQASKFDIEQKSNLYKPITPFRLDYAVKVGIANNTETLTDEEKVQALTWLGGDELNVNGYVNAYGKFVRRGTAGRIEVGGPLVGSHATNKAYVDATFVAKPATPNRLCVLSIDTNGNISTIGTSLNAANNGMVPLYNPSGNINVLTPTADVHAANKKYVDEAVANAGGGGGTKFYVHKISGAANSPASDYIVYLLCNKSERPANAQAIINLFTERFNLYAENGASITLAKWDGQIGGDIITCGQNGETTIICGFANGSSKTIDVSNYAIGNYNVIEI